MVWSSWKGAVLVLLASTGLAFGQQTKSPANPPNGGDTYMTVQEPGKPSQKCRVLYCWKMDGGKMAAQVQAIDTGEMITIINVPPMPSESDVMSGKKPMPITTRIYRWGRSRTCPPGCPQPEGTMVAWKDIENPAVIKGAQPISTKNAQASTGKNKSSDMPKIVTGPISSEKSPKNDRQPIVAPPTPKPVVSVKLPPPPPPVNIEGLVSKDSSKKPEVIAKQALTTPPALPKLEVAKNSVAGTTNTSTAVKATTDKLPPLPPVPSITSPSAKGVITAAKGTTETKTNMSMPPLPSASKSSVSAKPNMDPLSDPGKYAPREIGDRFPTITGNHSTTGNNSIAGMMTTPSPTTGLPPGSRSVVDAANGGSPQYIPVPIVTVPPPVQHMAAPQPQIPQAPQPNMYVNAFTPAMQNGQPMPPRAGMAPQAMANPYAMMQGAHPGYYGQYGYPYMQQSMPQMYSGPMPPNPVQPMHLNQVAYNQQAMAMAYNQFANPAMDRAGMPTSLTVANLPERDAVLQLLGTLKSALYPAQREWACIHLAKYDWRAHPAIVQGLLTAAEEDPAATVRAGCINSLKRMGVSQSLVAPTMRRLKSDVDPRVRQAAEDMLGDAVMPTSSVDSRPTPSTMH